MSYSRRELENLLSAGLPAAAVLGAAVEFLGALGAQAKPNSLINGVQIGTITYSYRQYAGPERRGDVEVHPRLRHQRRRDHGGAGRRALPARRGRGAGRRSGRWRQVRVVGGAEAREVRRRIPRTCRRASSSASGTAAVPDSGRGGGGRAAGGGRRGRMRRADATRRAEQQAAQQEAAAKLKAWRTSVSMDKFKKLRKMYNDAGVTIYAWKQLSPNMSDEEFEYVFNVAEALGCTHTTLELPRPTTRN